MNQCVVCSKPLSGDEIGITKKLVNRGTDRFYCKDCLAAKFKITVQDIDKLIIRFKQAGCSLF